MIFNGFFPEGMKITMFHHQFREDFCLERFSTNNHEIRLLTLWVIFLPFYYGQSIGECFFSKHQAGYVSFRDPIHLQSGTISNWWFQIFFIFTSTWGFMIQFDKHVFQMGWFNHHLGVSKNRGTPKRMVYNGETLLRWMIWGYHHFRKPTRCSIAMLSYQIQVDPGYLR